MKKFSLLFIGLNLIGLLVYINYAIQEKEDVLKNGKLVLLELAPVDPRSLMQGDYMMLNYAISSNVSKSDSIINGYMRLELDSLGVGQFVSLDESFIENKESSVSIKCHIKKGWWRGGIKIGAESFFFQEGKGALYEKAKYGGLRVDESGGSVLIGLYDENRELIKDTLNEKE